MVWRISNHADLEGKGGESASARWHTRGRAIVYCAEHPAAALLEALVHVEVDSLDELPKSYQLLCIALPSGVTIEELAEGRLPRDWRRQTLLTRSIGDAWLDAARASALRVPSAIAPHEFNVLLNPALLRRTGIRIVERSRYPFDARLRQLGASTRRRRR